MRHLCGGLILLLVVAGICRSQQNYLCQRQTFALKENSVSAHVEVSFSPTSVDVTSAPSDQFITALNTSLIDRLVSAASVVGSNLNHADIGPRITISSSKSQPSNTENWFISFEVSAPLGWESNRPLLNSYDMANILNQLQKDVQNSTSSVSDITITIGATTEKLHPCSVWLQSKLSVPNHVNMRCNNVDHCYVPGENHVTCRADGSSHSLAVTKRCLCDTDYAQINHTDTCGFKLTSTEECRSCLENEGTCYSTDSSSSQMAGCICPPTRSGINCSQNFVQIDCSKDTMTICVQPFNETIKDQLNKPNWPRATITTPMLTPIGSGKCRYRIVTSAKQADGGGNCSIGSWRLTVNKISTDPICDIQTFSMDNLLTYETRVDMNLAYPLHSFSFLAQCKFRNLVDKIGGITVKDKKDPFIVTFGSDKKASVTLEIYNERFSLLSTGAVRYVGNPVYFQLNLVDKHSPIEYDRLVVEEFRVSIDKDPQTVAEDGTVDLAVNRCPVDPNSIYYGKSREFDYTIKQAPLCGPFGNPMPVFRLNETAMNADNVVWFVIKFSACKVGSSPDNCVPPRNTCPNNLNEAYGTGVTKPTTTGTDKWPQTLSQNIKILKTPNLSYQKRDQDPNSNSEDDTKGSLLRQISVPMLIGAGCVVIVLAVVAFVFGYHIRVRKLKAGAFPPLSKDNRVSDIEDATGGGETANTSPEDRPVVDEGQED